MKDTFRIVVMATVVAFFSNGFGQVVINEVVYDPQGRDNQAVNISSYEWVELKNQSSVAVDIAGWELRADTYYSLSSLLASIPAGGFVIVYEGIGSNSNVDFSSGNTAYLFMGKTDSKLTASDDVSLYDSTSNSKNTIVDYFAYGAPSTSTNHKHAVDANIWTSGDYVNTSLASPGNSIEYDGSGNSSTDYFIQTSPTKGADNSLPVELNSFTALFSNGVVIIKWQTQSEINNQGFYVLRSINEDEGFERISPMLPGAGTTSSKHVYEYKDERAEPGMIYYYQLQQMDTNGETQSFGPLKVIVQANEGSKVTFPEKTRLVSNYPNPFNPGTTIAFSVSREDTFLSMTIYDLLGRAVRHLVESVYSAGVHEIKWDGADDFGRELTSGPYLCRMKAEDGAVSIIKLLKMQ